MRSNKISILPPDSISQSSTPYDHLPKDIIRINHSEKYISRNNNYCTSWVKGKREGTNSLGMAFL